MTGIKLGKRARLYERAAGKCYRYCPDCSRWMCYVCPFHWTMQACWRSWRREWLVPVIEGKPAEAVQE
jgi:hypothetical protein